MPYVFMLYILFYVSCTADSYPDKSSYISLYLQNEDRLMGSFLVTILSRAQGGMQKEPEDSATNAKASAGDAKNPDQRDGIIGLFREFDPKRNGKLSMRVLMKVLKDTIPHWSEEGLTDLFDPASLNGD